MQQKPNPILHMFFWGTGSGTILALLYLLFFLSLGTFGLGEMLRALISPDAWIVALQLGGLPGAALGLLTGFVLWFLSRGFHIPFSRAEMQAQRFRVYAVISTLTALGGFVLIGIFLGVAYFSYLGIILLFPPFIAGIAAAYAAHRYLFGLRLWSEKQYGVQKEKAKNFEHLEDELEAEEEESTGDKEKTIQRIS